MDTKNTEIVIDLELYLNGDFRGGCTGIREDANGHNEK